MQVGCSHSRINRVVTDHPGGTSSDHWECMDCATRFWPEYQDMHRIRLRDQFAMAALQGDIACSVQGEAQYAQTPEHSSLMAKRAYAFADAMLAQRDKKS